VLKINLKNNYGYPLTAKWNRNSAVGVVTMLRDEQQKNFGSSAGREKRFPLFQSAPTGCGANTTYSSMIAADWGWGMQLNTPLHLTLRLKMSAARPPASPTAFMACIVTVLSLPCFTQNKMKHDIVVHFLQNSFIISGYLKDTSSGRTLLK